MLLLFLVKKVMRTLNRPVKLVVDTPKVLNDKISL